jgi:hypothetical protein
MADRTPPDPERSEEAVVGVRADVNFKSPTLRGYLYKMNGDL